MAADRLSFEREYWQQGLMVCGIDEAGRGPLCGPIVVCGVALPIDYHNQAINDSKVLSAKQRTVLFKEIISQAVYYRFEIVSAQLVDQYNVYQATKMAMTKIASQFSGMILTDAMPLDGIEHLSLIKGDSRSQSIAAASICAKVVRDHIMEGYNHLYPAYGFARHKGYPTKEHLINLRRYGPLPFYRFTYGPVARLSQNQLLLED